MTEQHFAAVTVPLSVVFDTAEIRRQLGALLRLSEQIGAALEAALAELPEEET